MTITKFENATTTKFKEACAYCGYHDAISWKLSGLGQLSLLIGEGMDVDSTVLEIGAGCLITGFWLLPLVAEYCFIEPNTWLVEAAPHYQLKHLTKMSSRTDFLFGGVAFNPQFDYIFSHSVLSHASDSQLQQLMSAISKQLTSTGVGLVSLRICDDNGRPAIHSYHADWSYPDSRFFTSAMVEEAASAAGLRLEWRPDWRARMIAMNDNHNHDWIRLTK